MKRSVIGKWRFTWLVCVTLSFASGSAAQVSPSVVIENALSAIGGRAKAAKVDAIYAWAECTGPNGPYTTEISSTRAGKIYFSQKRRSGKAYFGRSDSRNAVTGSDPTGETRAAGEREVFAWRSHDFPRIALEVEGFFSRLEIAADGEFAGKPATIINAVDALGNPARIYFAKRAGSMLGFTIRDPFAQKAEEIHITFAGWMAVGGLLLPAKVVVTDKQGEFVLNFTKITVNDLASGKLALPPARTTSTANMALIPGATFEMGQDAEDIPKLMQAFKVNRAELFQEETPKRRVTMGSYYIDRTEVTNAQFRQFLEQNPDWQKGKIAPALHNGKYLQTWNGNDFPAGQDGNPVVFVSWYGAAAFCQAQGKRLPTEAEWEFAARGGLEGKTFPWGDEMPDKSRANYAESGLGSAAAVGKYLANGYGLHDMAGNVWEYLGDEWRKYPLSSNADRGGVENDRSFLLVKTRRALRGGSYGGGPVNMRVTYRDSHAPENAGDHVGFRCAMTAPVQSEAVNELLRMHYRDRFAHFNRDASIIFSQFADEYFSVGNGRINVPDRVAGQKRLQAYFDASTFLEWDDLTPPVIRVSDDGSMAYILVHKKVRRLAKDKDGREQEEIEIFAWTTTLKKLASKWKVTSVTSTRTPEDDK